MYPKKLSSETKIQEKEQIQIIHHKELVKC